MVKEKDIFELPELISFLSSDHGRCYVYRGQNRIWPGPLVPSCYRGTLSASKFIDFSPSCRLRGIGKTFFLDDNFLVHTESLEYKRNRVLTKYINGIFGYPLGQILMQQFGYGSEGLDVTSDPMVAVFFAKFDFKTKNFINKYSELGVIYRWPAGNTQLSLAELQHMDFYSCRPFMEGVRSIYPLATDETSYWYSWLLRKNLYNYIDEINLNWVRGEPRPFELLNLPDAILYQGRLAAQKGGLLFPDMILSGNYATDEFCPKGKYVPTMKFSAVEDISTRQGTEIFRFYHRNYDKELFKCKPESFFPRTDSDPFLYILLSTVDYPGDCVSMIHDDKIGGFFNFDAPPFYDPFL